MFFEKHRPERAQAARDFLVGCSLAGLMYVDVWRLLIAAPTAYGFFLTYSLDHYLAAAAAMLAMGVAAAAAGPVVRRAPRSVQFVARVLFLATAVIIANELRKSNEDRWPAVLGAWNAFKSALGEVLIVTLVVIVAAVVLRYAWPLSRFYRRALLAFSVFAGFLLVRGMWVGATLDHESFRQIPRPSHPGDPSLGRVVILVFDELDNEITFASRPPNLALPAFDELAATSITFDSAYAPGPNTMESLPSYLMGTEVTRTTPVDANSFEAKLRDGTVVSSDTAASIFSGPAAGGARVALIGFALPYCRLRLTAMTDVCESLGLLPGETVDVETEGFFAAAARQAESLLPFSARRAHIDRLRAVIEKSVGVAGDPSYSLVFLHLPLPHPPWVWDATHNRFSVSIFTGDGYLGNLALADRVLARLRDEMTESGTWDSTTVIVTSDHPWRAKPRNGSGPPDDRIPLMVKLAGMKTHSRVGSRTSSLAVTSLIPSFLGREITTSPALLQRVAPGGAVAVASER